MGIRIVANTPIIEITASSSISEKAPLLLDRRIAIEHATNNSIVNGNGIFIETKNKNVIQSISNGNYLPLVIVENSKYEITIGDRGFPHLTSDGNSIEICNAVVSDKKEISNIRESRAKVEITSTSLRKVTEKELEEVKERIIEIFNRINENKQKIELWKQKKTELKKAAKTSPHTATAPIGPLLDKRVDDVINRLEQENKDLENKIGKDLNKKTQLEAEIEYLTAALKK